MIEGWKWKNAREQKTFRLEILLSAFFLYKFLTFFFILLLSFFLSRKYFDCEKERRERDIHIHSWLLLVGSLYAVWSLKNEFASSTKKKIKSEIEYYMSKVWQKNLPRWVMFETKWSAVCKNLEAYVDILDWWIPFYILIHSKTKRRIALTLSLKYTDYLLMLFFFSSFLFSFPFPLQDKFLLTKNCQWLPRCWSLLLTSSWSIIYSSISFEWGWLST